MTQEDVDNMIGSVIILKLEDQNTSFLNEEYSNIIIEDTTIDCNEYLDGHFGINGTDICKTSKTFNEHNIYFKEEGEKFEYILYTLLEFDSNWILSHKGFFLC